MRKTHLTFLVIVALLVFTSVASAAPPPSKNFVAHLTGAAELPARETPARGTAVFQFSPDGTTLNYRLIAANIYNVTASHIHCGAADVNGPVGVTLYSGGAPGSGRVDGVLAAGSISMPDPGNGCGWASLDDVAAALLGGEAYVNVHTNDGVAPTNTGPGDFPGGEIRGQIYEAGASQ